MSTTTVAQQDQGILISGEEFAAQAGNVWAAERVDDKRVLLTVQEGALGVKTENVKAMASLPVDGFRELLFGLLASRWTGAVHVDTGYGLKKLYLTAGQVVFAASSVIDDRLGEVIYREAKISLDELTAAAAQVTKARKFGQVLLASSRFGNLDLWEALRLQVRQIVRSMFMNDRVYLELQEGSGLAPTEVVFEESGEDLIGECYAFGAAYRAFLARLRAETTVHLTQPRSQLATHPSGQFKPGTFLGDLLELIEAHANVQELLYSSKLIDNYTVSAMLHLANIGVAKLAPDFDGERKGAQSALAPLKSRLDGYSYVLVAVRKAFADAKRDFPIRDVAAFAGRLNPSSFVSVTVDGNGELTRQSVAAMLAQGAAHPPRVQYFSTRIDALTQFLLQIAGDNLEFQTAKKIRQDFRAISA